MSEVAFHEDRHPANDQYPSGAGIPGFLRKYADEAGKTFSISREDIRKTRHTFRNYEPKGSARNDLDDVAVQVEKLINDLKYLEHERKIRKVDVYISKDMVRKEIKNHFKRSIFSLTVDVLPSVGVVILAADLLAAILYWGAGKYIFATMYAIFFFPLVYLTFQSFKVRSGVRRALVENAEG